MIEIDRTPRYKVGEQEFKTIGEAQEYELFELLSEDNAPNDEALHFAKCIMANKDQVLDILTMTPSSRPKARKANGATRKPRTPKTPNRQIPDDEGAL